MGPTYVNYPQELKTAQRLCVGLWSGRGALSPPINFYPSGFAFKNLILASVGGHFGSILF
ncbi:MAG: hypothetical protein COU85_00260 [Candidatus Portnoybacteria bacterium CG10_big_fil_rev_8_21_14_0_10_44_7]|uniref:Uncharacterized protein n=1 Tax=Candidatus Portnoybacteria bacterium CG10_big_fil_rev_8_21_14_0_10_44_7 TaxID=1974816 RepID=A0A2M8KJG3_9BACT|nr:MAG: hypothetical protein COU85_00260 [Candidatus Portnoybacteria bacterium CG10_big_fil_rev_8_21_14_0_10_44_7]